MGKRKDSRAVPGKRSKGGRARARDLSQKRLYRLKVSLTYVPWDSQGKFEEEMARIIEIRGDQTLEELHAAIFQAFDREEEHLWCFEVRLGRETLRYVHPYMLDGVFESWCEERNGSGAHIDELGLTVQQKFAYVFDLGDNWQHVLEVLEIVTPAPQGKFPRIVEKVGDSPPQYPVENENEEEFFELQDQDEAEEEDDW